MFLIYSKHGSKFLVPTWERGNEKKLNLEPHSVFLIDENVQVIKKLRIHDEAKTSR